MTESQSEPRNAPRAFVEKGLNEISIQGRLGAAPEMRYLPNGDCVTRFNVAVSRAIMQNGQLVKAEPQWFPVELWRKPAEYAGTLLEKGMFVTIIKGEMRSSAFETEGQKRTAWVLEVRTLDQIPELRALAFPVGGPQTRTVSQDELEVPARAERPAATRPVDPATRSASAARPAFKSTPLATDDEEDLPF